MTSPGASPGKLLRVLGLAFGLAIGIGGTIGAGILRTPGDLAMYLPSAAWIMGLWVAGGIYCFICSDIFAELGTTIPRSGGLYTFAQRGLGNFAGFLLGYTDAASICAANAALGIVVGEYLGVLVPSVAGHEVFIAAIVILTLGALNWSGVRWGSTIQQVTTLIKTLAFLALIVACFVATPPAGGTASIAAVFPTGLKFATALLLAVQGVVFTYDSYYYVIYSSEEIENPGRVIPHAIFGAIALIAAIYIVLNIAFLRLIPVGAMAGDKFVGGSAAAIVFGARGGAVIRVLVMVSILGTINAYMLAAPRIFRSMAQDGLFARWATRVNTGGTPTTGLVVGTVASLAFLLTGTFERTLAVGAFFIVFNYMLAFLSYFGLRKKEPALERPWRAMHPWTGSFALTGAIVFLIAAVTTDTHNSLIALAVVLLAWPVFWAVRSAKARPA
ncbi:MAG TPA: APC family permease [Gemmatimonadales bacterium]|nr:APC family permease [Gemmatimonadales bacterium]